IYALSASGVSLIAGLMRVINFAHGEFYILGGYVSYQLSAKAGVPVPLAMAGSILIIFFLGLVIERLMIRRTYGDSMSSLIITFVLAIVLQNSALLLFGPYPCKPPDFVSGVVHLPLNIDFGLERLLAGVLSLIFFGLLYFVIKKTWFGKSVRAVAQDAQAAMLMGVDSIRINSVAFALGTAMAATAGVILSPIFPVTPSSSTPISLAAFVAVVLGGMGSLRGSLVAGLGLGIVESVATGYGSPAYGQVFTFILLIVGLLVRPSGLYGSRV
ncbi:MAG: branched-chain amino acid ABC transporter permease, partial [Deltaproteobacteria bacterium]|nr:branched-chain amino acid ABC transporter permease [Deltaproteobacteria bacterium]